MNCLSLACIVLLGSGALFAQENTGKDIRLLLPEKALLQALQHTLPLSFPLTERQIQGEAIIQTLEQLVIENNQVKVKGSLAGKNLFMVTSIADQTFRVQLGQVQDLPVTCTLRLHLDRAAQKLLLYPDFPISGQESDPAQKAMVALLSSISGKKYSIPLEKLKKISLSLGKVTARLPLEIVDLKGTNHTLELRLQPRTI